MTGRRTALALARDSAEQLRARGIENARLESELLLASVLGIGRLDLYLQHDRPLSDDEITRFHTLVQRRLRREPVQYILGEVRFRELTLKVDPRVLIPRPETEILVEQVLVWATRGRGDAATRGPDATGSHRRSVAPSHRRTDAPSYRLTAVDLGTGSGAIALSLLREGPFARVVATDLSADALALAAENAGAASVGERLELRRGALWDALRADERFDVVVSNPPYIALAERDALAPEVRAWEPAEALFAGDDGLAVLRVLIDGAPVHLVSGGLLALEVGLGQAGAVAERARETGAYSAVRVVADLAGRERVVLAETLAK